MKLKNNNHKKYKFKLIIFISIFIISLYLMFKYLVSLNININDKELVLYLLNDYHKEDIVKEKTKKRLDSFLEVNNLLNMPKINVEKEENVIKRREEALVYIYNSHQTEEYMKTSLAEYEVNPTVFVADYIMEDYLKQTNISSVVEERSVTEIRSINGWNYSGCYKASRILMEDAKKTNPSLKYFIDIHRDSLSRDKTTINIGDKAFAKIIFLIGLENSNYDANLSFTNIINDKVNEKYPGLSKGIYKKGGAGVNGVYNQDFSPYTILIEIGGNENTVTEVMNTTLAISEIISEVIMENETKEYS